MLFTDISRMAYLNTVAIVCDLEQLQTSVFDKNLNGSRSGVNRILQ